MSGELTANLSAIVWSTFMRISYCCFPEKVDKMHLQTAEHYAKALAEFGIQSMSALQALQLVPDE